MSEEKRIAELEKGMDQVLKALISLEARLVSEESQRLAVDASLAARIDSMQGLIKRSG